MNDFQQYHVSRSQKFNGTHPFNPTYTSNSQMKLILCSRVLFEKLTVVDQTITCCWRNLKVNDSFQTNPWMGHISFQSLLILWIHWAER